MSLTLAQFFAELPTKEVNGTSRTSLIDHRYEELRKSNQRAQERLRSLCLQSLELPTNIPKEITHGASE